MSKGNTEIESKTDEKEDKPTGRELTPLEEISVRFHTIVELLEEKNIISKNEYNSRLAMRLFEVSKATAFKEIEEEL
jgi:hypothetical protein